MGCVQLRRQQLASISMRSANTVIGDIESILHVPGKNVASLQVQKSGIWLQSMLVAITAHSC